jgi:hypothetical protein
MSSLIVYSNETGVYIGTDTISWKKGKDDLIPFNFVTKTIYLPQFKCCFAVQGQAFLLNQIFSFSMSKAIAYDASSFFDVCKNSLPKVLDTTTCDEEHIGTVFIIGFSIEAQSMCTYKSIVTKTNIEFETMGNVSFIKPMISNYDEIYQRVIELTKDKGKFDFYRSLIIEVMKQQKIEEKAIPINNKVGIGGQVQFTFMPPVDELGEITYLVEMAYTLDNYLNDYQTMLDQTVS